MKKTIVLFISMLIVASMVGCGQPTSDANPLEVTQMAVDSLNERSSFGEYLLLQPYEGAGTYKNPRAGTSNDNSLPGGDLPQPVDILSATGERLLSAYYDFYPSDSDNLVLSEFNLMGGDYHVFGIFVGDDLQNAVAVLNEEGYSPQEGDGAYNFYRSTSSDKKTIMRLDDILIVLVTYKSNTNIREIIIDVWSGSDS